MSRKRELIRYSQSMLQLAYPRPAGCSVFLVGSWELNALVVRFLCAGSLLSFAIHLMQITKRRLKEQSKCPIPNLLPGLRGPRF